MIANSKIDIINLRRDQLSSTDDTLKSITLNPTELCNRRCGFCPRSESYPNQNLHMSESTAERISEELTKFGFSGRLGWSGNGEPLLTKNFLKLVKTISSQNPQLKFHEINTNGDLLTVNLVDKIYESGINHIIVSVYDGEKELNKFEEMFSKFPSNTFTLRKSYTSNYIGFTNRAGNVNVNKENLLKNISKKCFIPFYKLFLDWNGDVIVCCEDWGRKSKSILNINTHSLKEIWDSDELNKYRLYLKDGYRSKLSPCNTCNIDGEQVGENVFKKFYEK